MTPAEIDDLLVEPMARAMCIAQKRDPDAPRWVHAGTHETCGVCWHENIDAALATQRITLKSAGLFIGPEEATRAMIEVPFDGTQGFSGRWKAAVAEWQRGGGA